MTQPVQLSDALARVLPEHSSVTANGELAIGSCALPALAEEYGTPAYVFDEQGLRNTMRRYRELLAERWSRSRVCFASKSLPCAAAYGIAAEEGLSVDVAGEGELRMALASGVEPRRIVLHGNAKGIAEIELAVEQRIGLIVVDNEDDITNIARFAAESTPQTESNPRTESTPQSVLLRVIPEIDARTHPSIATGGRASKFGLPIGRVKELVEELKDHPSIKVRGIHLHLGSQIMDIEPFAEAVSVLASVGEFEVYNLGGGLGVNYSDDDEAPQLEAYLDRVVEAARRSLPADAELVIEPGRSLVAQSGVTIYSVRNVKHAFRTFVAVDGGMADQMNIALTDTRFTAVVADRVTEQPTLSTQLVGRQCESGDLIVDEAQLADPAPGDTVVVAGTGAYGYTLVNNYNGALHPPVIFCADGNARLAVPRQTYEQYLEPHRAEIRRLTARRAASPRLDTHRSASHRPTSTTD